MKYYYVVIIYLVFFYACTFYIQGNYTRDSSPDVNDTVIDDMTEDEIQDLTDIKDIIDLQVNEVHEIFCNDQDGDGYGQGCNLGEDCDDTTPLCTTDCRDNNNNGIPDCREICHDLDGDGYGQGDGCEGIDECDNDPDNWTQQGCQNCTDNDQDGYYTGCDGYNTISGPDVDDENPYCDTTPVDTDNDGYCENHDCDDNNPDCSIDCSDNDSDGWCGDIDCDDTTPFCNEDCSDTDNEGNRRCCLLNAYIIGHLDTDGNSMDVYVDGNYAYVADGWQDVKVINISDPTDPVLVSTVSNRGFTASVFVTGGYLYAGKGNWNNNSWEGLKVLDVNNNYNEIGSIDLPDWAVRIYVSGNYVYVAADYSGMLLVNINDLSSTFIEGYVEASHRTYDVYISNNFAYIADGYGGFKIADIIDPANPQITGQVTTQGFASTTFVTGNHAYIGEGRWDNQGWAGIELVDISDPFSPVIINSIQLNDWVRDIYVSGNYAYIANDNDGFIIIDTRSLTDLQVINEVSLSGRSSALYISGHYAYVASGREGLYVISLNCD